MEETVGLISQYGILTVLAAIFIFSYLADKKDQKQRDMKSIEREDAREKDIRSRDDKYNESLLLLSRSTDNIATALELLKSSNETSISMLKTHDERSIKMAEQMTEIKAIVHGCRNRK
jgi:hypothetical protein